MEDVTQVPVKPKRKYKKRAAKAGFKIIARDKRVFLCDSYSLNGDLIVAIRGNITTYIRVGEAAVVVEMLGFPALTQLATTTSTGPSVSVYGELPPLPPPAYRNNEQRNAELMALMGPDLGS